MSSKDPESTGLPAATVPAPTASPAARDPRPWLTWTAAIACVLVFCGVGLRATPPTWELLARWGAPPAQAIWGGAYWALVTCVFVHAQLWHLVFNLYWLWILGGVLERAVGHGRWLGFFLAAAVVSSGTQLSLTGVTGIGMSGVLYAMFGFMWMMRVQEPSFARVLSRQTVLLFLLWLVGCVVATRLGIARVGNAAHAGGLFFGTAAGIACATRVSAARRAVARFAAAALVAVSLATLFWSPWCFNWVAAKAYEAHARRDFRSAVSWYGKARKFGKKTPWVLGNLAFAQAALGDASSVRATVDELRAVDPDAARKLEERLAMSPGASGEGRPD